MLSGSVTNPSGGGPKPDSQGQLHGGDGERKEWPLRQDPCRWYNFPQPHHQRESQSCLEWTLWGFLVLFCFLFFCKSCCVSFKQIYFGHFNLCSSMVNGGAACVTFFQNLPVRMVLCALLNLFKCYTSTSKSGYCFLNEAESEAKITVPSSGLAWWLQSFQACIQGVVNT